MKNSHQNGNNHTNGTQANAQNSLIQLKNLSKSYETEAGTFPALKNINLNIDKGDFVAIIGKSGSGKTTLINMITGIDRPTEGEVIIGGIPIHDMPTNKLAKWRGTNMGVIFQFFQLLPTLTAVENVILPMAFCKLFSRKERRERAMGLLKRVNMQEYVDKLPATLSGGQQQRVAIARSLATDPAILIADEPTGNLDSKTAEEVFRLFENMVAAGRTIIMVTHDVDLAKRARRSLTVADGVIINEEVNRSTSNRAGSSTKIKNDLSEKQMAVA